MRREKIVLIGGGGHARVVIDAIRCARVFDIAGIVDNALKAGSKVAGIHVLGADDELAKVYKKGVRYAFISVGSVGHCDARRAIDAKTGKIGFHLPAVVHPGATVAADVVLGEGTFVAASATINPGTVTGRNVIINTSASVDHDCAIGDFAHIAPGAVLGGGVVVGEGTHIGARSVVNQYKKIGKDCLVGSGSVVTDDIPSGHKAFGNPCRVRLPVSKKSRVFIIAEAGVNHNGSLATAKKLVDAAVAARADAVKFQTFRAEKLVSNMAEKAPYQKKNMPGRKESQLEMLKKLELSRRDFMELKKYCDRKKIIFLSTPFDAESVDLLDGLVPLYKISSGNITDIPFLKHVASRNKPIILSTGMSTMVEVERAVGVIGSIQRVASKTPYPPLTLLHCTTNYPCPFDEVNLRVIRSLRARTGLPVGYSDHTAGIDIAIAAAALECCVIEKHFTLDRNMPGPDHQASVEPDELARLVEGVRHVETSLGSPKKVPASSEIAIMKVARKSLVAARDLKKGTRLREDMFAIKRPGHGIQPAEAVEALGRVLARDKKADEVILWKDLT